MIFEDLPTTPTSEELIDQGFSRAARAGRGKSGRSGQQSMLQTASNVLSDNLANIVTSWPDFDTIHPFYFEVADALVDVNELRQSLSRIQWASRQTKQIGREAQRKLPNDIEGAKRVRKQAFARMASVVREISDDLARIGSAHQRLRRLPDIDPDVPTIVTAGYPNVGKSSFVNAVTNARSEIASYPFTTKTIAVGHIEHEHITYQLVDTPGLLDRQPDDRNEIEAQAVSALTHIADCILFILDPSEECGYPLSDQLELRETVREEFEGIPLVTVANKADRSTATEADLYMSIQTGDNVQTTLQRAIEAIDYEPDLPFTN